MEPKCTPKETLFCQALLSLLLIILDVSAEDRDRSTPIPDFLHTPTNVTFHKGELAVLRCTILNLGTKTVVWRRVGSSFPLTAGVMTVDADSRFQVSHVSYKNQWDLMIKNVQPEDEGIYECQVSSRDNSIRRLVALVVEDPLSENPEIRITPPQYVERGDSVVLTCNATGEYYPPDEMDWFRNGERLTSHRSKGVQISKKYSLSKKAFSSELKIERATREDDGTYVCRSSNLQITSTKVHVLNGETFHKKRGTMSGQKLESRESHATAVSFSPILIVVLLVCSRT